MCIRDRFSGSHCVDQDPSRAVAQRPDGAGRVPQHEPDSGQLYRVPDREPRLPGDFLSGDEGKSYAPMLVLGLAAQQNLFVLWDDTWDRRVYLPAYVRRFPFCMTRVMVDGKEAPERVACVEKIAINDKGEKLFNDKGEALPEWQQREKLLFEFEADLGRTDEMCKLLAQHQLLEPFTMQATPNNGEPLQLTGMYRVSEEKLAPVSYTHLRAHETPEHL